MAASKVIKSIGIILAALVGMAVLSALVRVLARETAIQDDSQYDMEYREVLPDASAFEKVEQDIPYYIGFDNDGNVVGFAFITTEVASERATRGFGGPVPVFVGMDSEGRITGLKVLPNDETPAYAEPVFEDDYLGQFIGKRHNEKFLVNVDIDGVSGATVTSEAVAGGVGEAASIIAEIALDGEYESPPALAKQFRITNPGNLIMVALVALAIVGYKLRVYWLRYVTLGVSVVFLGFRFGHLLSVRHFVGLFTAVGAWISGIVTSGDATLPAQAAGGFSWFLPLILGGAAAFFIGRVWCGWICPFGAITELIGRLFPWKPNMPQKADRSARYLKYAMLVAAPILFILAGGDRALLFEPFADAFNLSFMRLPLLNARVIWLIALAIASLFITRFYCRYLCPVGAGLGFISGRSPFVSGGPQDCLECAKCDRNCVNAGDIPSREMAASECLACGECAACSRIQKAKSRKKESGGNTDSA